MTANEPKPQADWQVPAGYPSRCPECGDRIREGDPVGLVEGDWLCSGYYDTGTGSAFDDDHHRDLIIDDQMGVR